MSTGGRGFGGNRGGHGRGRGDTYSPSRGRGRGRSEERGSFNNSGRGRGSADRGGRGRGQSRGLGGHGSSQSPKRRLEEDEWTSGSGIFRPDGIVTGPDTKITKKEDENALKNQKSPPPDLTKNMGIPPRPSYGRNGKQSWMWTNYFHVQLDEKAQLFKYDIQIEPASERALEIKNPRKRRQLFNLLLAELDDFRILGPAITTDYANVLVTCRRLFDKNQMEKIYHQVYRGEYDETRTQRDPAEAQIYLITVRLRNIVPVSEIMRYVTSERTDVSDATARQDVIQTLNIVMAGRPNKDTRVFQTSQNKFYQYPINEAVRNFAETYDKYDLSGGLIAVRGYYSSIRTSTSRFLLNINAQCSAFYPEINLFDLLELFRQGSTQPPGNPEVEGFINKLRVRTKHTKDGDQLVTSVLTIRGFSHKYEKDRDSKGNQRYNNDGSEKMKGTKGAELDFATADTIKFFSKPLDEPAAFTVREYYHRVLEISLRNPGAMVLNCGSDDKPTWIPPELCTVMPGQPFRGTLNDLQTSNMHFAASRPPAENARRITKDGLRVIGIDPKDRILDSFGIHVDPRMLSVQARLLAAPDIIYNGEMSQKPTFATWNVSEKKFFSCVDVTDWSVLNLSDINLLVESWEIFLKVLRDCGMKSRQPRDVIKGDLLGDLDDDRNDELIRRKIRDISRNFRGILLVVLPFKSAPIYARVKFWADVEYGIHTVCILGKNAFSKSLPYWANIAHKFNLKLGGINHQISPDALGSLRNGHTMVVGIDVSHPSPTSMENSPSVVAMVASVDESFAQWPGNFRIQQSRQEIQKLRQDQEKSGTSEVPKDAENMVSNIATLMGERLSAFGNKNRRYPKNILIYRDGVSEGQYPAVLDQELKPIQDLCKEKYRGKGLEPPKITIVIVGKRHHTRFYPSNEDDADKQHGYNPLNGTVVDRGITMQDGWDFYLQAHQALKGTARPAHYVVIHNGMELKPDELESITHNLSYLYQRATKAVSYCPPAFYADILCERGRCYLMKYVNVRGHPPGTKFNPDDLDVPWRTDVHKRLQNTMFYI